MRSGFEPNEILSYDELCEFEGVGRIQKGMTFRPPPATGVILMSQRPGATYGDGLDDDGNLLYEGHDAPRTIECPQPKQIDQPLVTGSGALTQNGLFVEAVERYKTDEQPPATFHVYEKLLKGVWAFRGMFALIDYRIDEGDNHRMVYRFALKLMGSAGERDLTREQVAASARQIPTGVKVAVYRRDRGRCVICNATDNLHFDHDVPVARGGNATVHNIRLLCARHNLSKGSRIQ